ncbi:MAG: DUF6783 domain-containing protein [Blautia sp.]
MAVFMLFFLSTLKTATDALIRAKSPVNCDTHFAENLF